MTSFLEPLSVTNNFTGEQTHEANNEFARILSDHIVETQDKVHGRALDNFSQNVHREGWRIAEHLLEGDFSYMPMKMIRAGLKLQKVEARSYLTLKDEALIAVSRTGVYSREEWRKDKKNLLKGNSIGSNRAIIVLHGISIALVFKVTNETGIPEFVAAVLGTNFGKTIFPRINKKIPRYSLEYSCASESNLGNPNPSEALGFWRSIGRSGRDSWESCDLTLAQRNDSNKNKHSWEALQLKCEEPNANTGIYDGIVKMNTLVMEVINVVSIITKIGGTKVRSYHGVLDETSTIELEQWDDVPKDGMGLLYRYIMSDVVGGPGPGVEIFAGFGMQLLDCYLV